MAFRTTPQLGPQLDEVSAGVPYWDTGLGVGTPANGQGPSPQLGTKEIGSDGGEYWWVKASADIDATATTGTQVTITYPAYTVATNTGGFYTKPATAVKAGDCLWVRRGAHNAVPA